MLAAVNGANHSRAAPFLWRRLYLSKGMPPDSQLRERFGPGATVIISDIRQELDGDRAFLRARIAWEIADRADDEYFFSFPARFFGRLGEPADAFFCAALVPALKNGEARIRVGSPICSTLREGATEALFWLRSWYPQDYAGRSLEFECATRSERALPSMDSALFMSGGVDACFSLVWNQRNHPPGTAGRIRYGLTILGFDVGGKRASCVKGAQTAFDLALKATNSTCSRLGIESVGVHTNVRHLDDTSGFWGKQFVGSALSSVAHAFGGSAGRFYISSSGRPLQPNGYPHHYGTNVLLDPCYSSQGVTIKHYGMPVTSRIARLKLLGETPWLLNDLRVCFFPPSDRLNCGRCEKCIRTKLILEVLGLHVPSAVLGEPLTEAEVSGIEIDSEESGLTYMELSPLAHAMGYRHALALDRAVTRFKRRMTYQGAKDSIKVLDDRFLGGLIQRWRRA